MSKPVTLSSHVLDTSLGTPASGIAIKLEKLVDQKADKWEYLTSAVTNSDGRAKEFPQLEANGMFFFINHNEGMYRLVFDTKSYFESSGVKFYFYPYIPIVFQVTEGHYHVPLLLSTLLLN